MSVPAPGGAGVAPAPPDGGLSQEEAARRLAEVGPNEVRPRPVPWSRRLLRQLTDPLILVLVAAGALTLATGDLPDFVVISFVVVVNTLIGVVQEVRADRAVAELTRLAAPTARVVRDGELLQVPSVDLVPGDLVEVSAGDVVPADLALLEAPALQTDESALTGEALPVDKTSGGAAYGGTVVTRGRARAVVAATGSRSALGRIAGLLEGAPPLTPLQLRLARLGRTLAGVAIALSSLVVVLGLLRGVGLERSVVTGISLVVAAVPESLPAVVTLALALGAHRMARRNAIVRNLPAVETLGSVTVLATDKTGTLTEARMVADGLWTPERPLDVPAVDGGPAPDLLPAERSLLRALVLCNDARPPGEDAEEDRHDDPLEVTFLSAAASLGVDVADVRRQHRRVDEVPFDSERRRMTTVHQDEELPGTWLVLVKGAPEVLLAPPLVSEDDPGMAGVREWVAAAASRGARVLVVAAARHTRRPSAETLEDGLRLVGAVRVADTVRPEAPRTIDAFRRAGILPVLVSGDHPATAEAVAREVGIIGPAPVRTLTGEQLGAADGLQDVRVFARISPEQKVDVVEFWRRRGEVVAMTGDGVNDGPALRRADVGVAMGRRGTDVARQAADLVLADDDLGTVVEAVHEGRRVLANVRRFLVYGLSGGLAEVVVMVVGPFVGLGLPLLPAQILWINLLTHGLPGVAIGAEPVDEGLLARRPRPVAESILGPRLWWRLVTVGSVIALMTLGVSLGAQAVGAPWQSMAFVTLGCCQLGVALASRSRRDRSRPSEGWFLTSAVLGALLLQVGGVYLPLLRTLLGTEPLTAGQLAVAASGLVVGWLALRLAPDERPREDARLAG